MLLGVLQQAGLVKPSRFHRASLTKTEKQNKTKDRKRKKKPTKTENVNPNLFVKEGCASKHWLPASGL